MSRQVAEGDRRAGNVAQLGVVTAVDPGASRAQVDLGGLPTAMIPVGQLRAGPLSLWWMPAEGEQVLVISPSGDFAQAVIVCSVFAGNAPGADPTTPVMDLAGGTMQILGNLEVTGDVVASGVSLVTHTHGGVFPGPANTGGPN